LRGCVRIKGLRPRRQLRELGLSPHQIKRRVSMGAVVEWHRSVFVVGGVPVTAKMRAVAACAAEPTVVVSHASAGRRLGMRGIGVDERLHITTNGTGRRSFAGCVVHASFKMDPKDVVCIEGVRYTSAARTVFDIAATVTDSRLESLVEQVLHEGMCSVAELADAAVRLGEHGRRGSARFRRVLGSRPAGLAAVASDLELQFERAVIAAGLPRPERQFPIAVGGGLVLHPDFYWPTARLAVEVDHVT
jgi:hypothetical protein